MSDRITLEELTADEALLGPWYSGEPSAADARVAHPRDAAAHALLTALNAADDAKGVIKILAPSAEQKRLIRCFLEAMLEQPKLKAMVKRLTPETIFLHGGIRIVIDTNEAKLTRDVIATILLDPSVDEPTATVWLEIDDEGKIETKEHACIRAGIDWRQGIAAMSAWSSIRTSHRGGVSTYFMKSTRASSTPPTWPRSTTTASTS